MEFCLSAGFDLSILIEITRRFDWIRTRIKKLGGNNCKSATTQYYSTLLNEFTFGYFCFPAVDVHRYAHLK